MTTGRAYLLALLLVSGCVSGSFDRLPRQDEAEAIVWRDLYGEEAAVPPVEWISDDDWAYGGCALAEWKVQVQRLDTKQRDSGGEWVTRQFSQTAYSHELMHIHTFLRTGDIDAAHWRGDWELAEETARLALWEAGL